MHIVEVDTKVTNGSLTQNQCLKCVTPPLMHVEIPQLRDATELINDGMIKLGDVHYQIEQGRSQRWGDMGECPPPSWIEKKF